MAELLTELMAELPTEIILVILSKLPVKSLVRFQCVCKSWQSMIKSPNFIKTHLNQTLITSDNSDCHLLVLENNYAYSSLYSLELDHYNDDHLAFTFSEYHHPFIIPSYPSNIVGSCNGLVCISILSAKRKDIFLFNPLTYSHRKLFSIRCIDLAHGFGYDRMNDDYKFLIITVSLTGTDNNNTKVEVYSLKRNSLRCIINGFPYSFDSPIYKGDVLVNEALHYVVTKKIYSRYNKFIASFDLRTETFSLIDCPNYDNDDDSYSGFVLSEIGGCLCLLIHYYTYDTFVNALLSNNVDLWVMKEYANKESWVKLFSIIGHQQHIDPNNYFRALSYSEDGKRILLQRGNSPEYIWYNLESRVVEKITVHGLPCLPYNNFRTAIYRGSLVSLEDK